MREVPEPEVLDHHLGVVPPCCHLTVHLGGLLCLSGVIVLDRPLRFAHLLEHVDRKHVHHEVQNVVDHDRYKDRIEVIGVTSNPVIHFLVESVKINLKDPNGSS